MCKNMGVLFIAMVALLLFSSGCSKAKPKMGTMTAPKAESIKTAEVEEITCDDGIPCTEDFFDKKKGRCSLINHCLRYSVGVTTEPVPTDKYYVLTRIILPATTWDKGLLVWHPGITEANTKELLSNHKFLGGFVSRHGNSTEPSHFCLKLAQAKNEGKNFPMVFQAFKVSVKNGNMSLINPSKIKVVFSVTSSPTMTEVSDLKFTKITKTPGYLAGDPYEKYGYYSIDNIIEECQSYFP